MPADYPADRTILITPRAATNLENMQKRVWDIQNAYGVHSSEAEKAQFSFSQMLMTILRWPGRVTAEDDLSLLIDSSITLGLIFHHVRHKNEDGSWTTDPLLGEWSSHS